MMNAFIEDQTAVENRKYFNTFGILKYFCFKTESQFSTLWNVTLVM